MVAIIVCIPPFWLEGVWGGGGGGVGVGRGEPPIKFQKGGLDRISIFRVVPLIVIRCTTRCHSLSLAVIRCHSLSLVVIHCHSLCFVVTPCLSLYHSLSPVVLFVVTRCHSLYHLLSFVVTRCTNRLCFYKRSSYYHR